MNGQAEATNNTLSRILNRMVYEEPKKWTGTLSLALLAYRTSRYTSTQTTLFSSIYKAEAVAFVEGIIPSVRLAIARKLAGPHNQVYDEEAL